MAKQKQPIIKPEELPLEIAIDKAISSTPEETIIDQEINPTSFDNPIEIQNINNQEQIEILKKQVRELTEQGFALKKAVELMSNQNAQILEVMQGMITNTNTNTNTNTVSSIKNKEKIKGDESMSIWAKIISDFRDSLANLAYIVHQAQAQQPIQENTNTDISVSDFKGINQAFRIFAELQKMNAQLRELSKAQIISDPLTQIELLKDPRFQQLLLNKFSMILPQQAQPQQQAQQPLKQDEERHL